MGPSLVGCGDAEPRLSGVLLAGGASRRMGCDKAWVVVHGEPLAFRALRALDAVAEDVVVASGDGHRLAALGRPQVGDIDEGAGPLAGVAAGLASARHDLVAVLAVDLPHAEPAVLRRLATTWRGEAAVVPLAHGHAEVLHAVWSRGAHDRLRARLAAGQLGVRDAARGLGARLAGPAVWGDVDPGAAFAYNVNHPGDLQAVQIPR